MSEYHQAPAVYHCGTKILPGRDNTYALSSSLLKTIFNQLNGKCGNQLKLITLLMGVPGSGQYRLSQKEIMTMTCMDESGYKRARKALIDLGWITHRDGMIQVHFDKIRGSAASALEKENTSSPTPPPADPALVLERARKAFGNAKTSSFANEWN
jgi:hypothetical protein